MPQEHAPDLSILEHWLVTARIRAFLIRLQNKDVYVHYKLWNIYIISQISQIINETL
jgi:hypothetical protein